MRNVMKKAHEITKKIIRKGDSYKATFRLALSLAHSLIRKGANKMVELVGSEKQIKWANDLRMGFKGYIDNFITELVDEIGITELIQEELEDAEFETIEDALNVIQNQNSAKKIIDVLKYEDFVKNEKKDRIEIKAKSEYLTKEAIISLKECIVCSTIIELSELK